MEKNIQCPFCGTKRINELEFTNRTGMEIERTLEWNGELKIILKLGELAVESHKRNGQDTIDKEKIFEILKKEQEVIEESRRNIENEQRETFAKIAKEKSELAKEKEQLLKLKEEVIKEESVKIPEKIIKKLEEMGLTAVTSNTEIKEILYKLIHNVKVSGNLQEEQLTRRLKLLNTGDKIEYLGGTNQEDILITVRENSKDIGFIKIDSKNVKKWDKKYVEQMQRYLKDNKIDFGLIATTAMPKDAAGSDFFWEDNILIVNQNVAESVYLVCRYLTIKNVEYANEYNKKTFMLKENKKKLEEIKIILDKASFKRYFTFIANEVVKGNKGIDDLENYFGRKITLFRTCNSKIMRQINDALDNEEELQEVLSKE
jgi:hypothetical protein